LIRDYASSAFEVALRIASASCKSVTVLLLSYPELALIRGDPRLPAFRRKLGFP